MDEPRLYCPNAFNGLSLTPRGDARLCCLASNRAVSGSDVLNIKTSNLDEIFNSDSFSQVREYFQRGQRHDACKKCWDEEDAGKTSKRQRDALRFPELKNGTRAIRLLELNAGNLCNIKCRTCSPFSSSQWIKEAFETNTELKSKFNILKNYNNSLKTLFNSWDDDSPIWQQLKSLSTDLILIDFFGGEPTLIKPQWEFLKYCISVGATNKTLHFNTNGTSWDPEYIQILNKFDFVSISVSIDGLEDKFEYMRYPAKWSVLLDNMKMFKQLASNSNHSVDICHTISAFNVYYIPEFIEYFKNEWNIYLNLVHDPSHFAVNIFPESVKQQLIKKLKTTNASYMSQVEPIINLIKNGKFDENLWKMFKEKIAVHDEYRHQDYYETFKEFGRIINSA